MTMTATYSINDDKLRFYSTDRLDEITYARLKAAGFSCASNPDRFLARSWTPEREDLLLELCGEIGNEETSIAIALAAWEASSYWQHRVGVAMFQANYDRRVNRRAQRFKEIGAENDAEKCEMERKLPLCN